MSHTISAFQNCTQQHLQRKLSDDHGIHVAIFDNFSENCIWQLGGPATQVGDWPCDSRALLACWHGVTAVDQQNQQLTDHTSSYLATDVRRGTARLCRDTARWCKRCWLPLPRHTAGTPSPFSTAAGRVLDTGLLRGPCILERTHREPGSVPLCS